MCLSVQQLSMAASFAGATSTHKQRHASIISLQNERRSLSGTVVRDRPYGAKEELSKL